MPSIKRTLAKADYFAQDVGARPSRDTFSAFHPCLLCLGRRLPPPVIIFHDGHYGPDGRAGQVLNVTLFPVE
jgi:hypothetical protein